MSNFTLLRADRATHLKIILIAAIASVLVVGVGTAARLPHETGRLEANGPAQAGQPLLWTRHEATLLR